MDRGCHCPLWFPRPGPDGRLRGELNGPLIGLIRRQIERGDVFVLQVVPGDPFAVHSDHLPLPQSTPQTATTATGTEKPFVAC